MSDSQTETNQATTTTLNRRWLLKMVAILVMCVGFAAFFAYDGFIAYPKRGALHTDFMLQAYLANAASAGKLAVASVEDPAAAYTELNTRVRSGLPLTATDQSKLAWLKSLSRIRSLAALARANREALAQGGVPDTETMFADPGGRKAALDQALSQRSQPTPLSAYDIPSQYIVGALCTLGAIWMVLVLIRASQTRYRYDHASHTLTLPDGRTITPSDIVEVDKRKWDKFFVFLRLTDEKQKAGEEEIKLDLLRYVPLEEWFLEMEKLTPGYEPPEAEASEEEEAGSEEDEPAASGADEETKASTV